MRLYPSIRVVENWYEEFRDREQLPPVEVSLRGLKYPMDGSRRAGDVDLGLDQG